MIQKLFILTFFSTVFMNAQYKPTDKNTLNT